MNRLSMWRPSAALVVSIVALMVALGGTSYAALMLPRNSVGAKQLKRGSVTGTKIKSGAVTAAKVRTGSLLANDFKAGQLPAGPKGVPGPQGPPAGANAVVRSSSFVVGPGTEDGGFVLCHSGEVATGGGVTPGGITAGQIFPLQSTPSDSQGLVASSGTTPRGWRVIVYNATGSPETGAVFTICVPA
jgi:hypothetical protein